MVDLLRYTTSLARFAPGFNRFLRQETTHTPALQAGVRRSANDWTRSAKELAGRQPAISSTQR
jgi:hypothetical protein